MEVKAITRNVPISTQKMREVARQIQGMPVGQAQAVLAVVPRKGARVVAKTLKSAMANAEDLKANKPDYKNLDTAILRVKLAVAGRGPHTRRFIPKARGSAGPIIKRSCNVKIVLSDE